jgi:hypothetical protein
MAGGDEKKGAGDDSKKDERKATGLTVGGFNIPLTGTLNEIDLLIKRPFAALNRVLDKRRDENAAAHIEVVRKKRASEKARNIEPNDMPTSFGSALGFWAEEASQVDPADTEQSAIWRAILDNLLSTPREGEDLLEAVKTLSRSQIQTLILHFFQTRMYEAYRWRFVRSVVRFLFFNEKLPHIVVSDRHFAALRRAGLIKRHPYWFWVAVVGTFSFGYWYFQTRGDTGDSLPPFYEWRLAPFLYFRTSYIEAMLLIGLTIALIVGLSARIHTLTPLGMALKMAYRDYVRKR